MVALSIFFGAITVPQFKSISVVRMCEWSHRILTPQCHVTIPLKIKNKKIKIENIAKTVFFLRLCNIYQWANSNAPHTHFTVIFLKSNLF